MEPIYLDNIAGTKPDKRVVDEVIPYLTEKYGNPAAHFYPLGRQCCGVALQKAAFWRLKGGLLQPQRLPFAV